MQPIPIGNPKRSRKRTTCPFCQEGRPATEIVSIVRRDTGEEMEIVRMCKECLSYKSKNLGKWMEYKYLDGQELAGGAEDF